VLAAAAALTHAYTDTELVCQIRVDDLDDAGTYEVVHHIRGKATPDEFALGVPSPVASSSNFLSGIYGLTPTRSRKSLACLVLPRLVPRSCVLIGITSSSRVELVKVACGVIDPSASFQSFVSPKSMPHAPTKATYFQIDDASIDRYRFAMERKLAARWYHRCSRPCRDTRLHDPLENDLPLSYLVVCSVRYAFSILPPDSLATSDSINTTFREARARHSRRSRHLARNQ
jgi:hypothetical protein